MRRLSRGSAASGVPIGSNVVPINSAARPIDTTNDRRLTENCPLGRNAPAVNPHGDARLLDLFSGQRAQSPAQRNLPANSLEQPLETHSESVSGLSGVHVSSETITISDIYANTASVIPFTDNGSMARTGGRTTDFWHRLKAVRTSHKPPLSMIQTDIAKQYGVVQGAVGKWKTGGEKGTSKPEPELVERMAADADCSFEYLWWGRGPMRPTPPPDPITQQVVEEMAKLAAVENRLAVLHAALAQQQLERPEVAARIRDAQRETERRMRNTAKKSG